MNEGRIEKTEGRGTTVSLGRPLRWDDKRKTSNC